MNQNGGCSVNRKWMKLVLGVNKLLRNPSDNKISGDKPNEI
jgi:hypothetical protein